MKNFKFLLPMALLVFAFNSGAMAKENLKSDAVDHPSKPCDEHEMEQFQDGFILLGGGEVGIGSGVSSAALGVNIGYKSGSFLIGTSLKGQIINIDHVNYQALPYSLNLYGVSFTQIPETSNSQNDKTLKGRMLGFSKGGKIAFGHLVESNPIDNTKKEFLTLNFGFGF